MFENSNSDNQLFIIAEIGVNHDGSLSKAKELVDGAKKAGAHAVKFQSFKTETLASKSTPKVPYQKNADFHETHFDMLKSLELSHESQSELRQYCIKVGIEFMSTPYTLPDAYFLHGIGVEKFKVASADIVDLPLHELIASFGKHTIVSVGMATESEIEVVSKIYSSASTKVTFMHCTSEYPTPPAHAHMRRIQNIKKITKQAVGFSDHTDGHVAAILGVALGCRIFEKHITLNSKDPGPDHAASMELEGFQEYCKKIKEADLALGEMGFARTQGEELMAQTSRKSIHTKRRILAGEILEEKDLVLMRPGTGIFWENRKNILGRRAKSGLEELELILLENLE